MTGACCKLPTAVSLTPVRRLAPTTAQQASAEEEEQGHGAHLCGFLKAGS